MNLKFHSLIMIIPPNIKGTKYYYDEILFVYFFNLTSVSFKNIILKKILYYHADIVNILSFDLRTKPRGILSITRSVIYKLSLLFTAGDSF